MKSTSLLALLFTALFSSAQGLAFITAGVIRPVAAMKTVVQRTPFLNNAKESTSSSLSTTTNAILLDEKLILEETIQSMQNPSADFGCDFSTQEYRSEMLDLVYERSLNRMDTFSL